MKLPSRLTSTVMPSPPPPPGSPAGSRGGGGAGAGGASTPDSSRLRAVPAQRELAEELKQHSENFRKIQELDRGAAEPRGGDGVPVDLSRQHCSTVRSPIPAMLAESMSLADEPDQPS
jgi:hypothetical protein